MRKIVAALLVSAMMLSFTACSSNTDTTSSDSSTVSSDVVSDSKVVMDGDSIVKTQDIDSMHWEYRFNFSEDILQNIEVTVETDSDDMVNNVVEAMTAVGFSAPQIDGTTVTLYSTQELTDSYAGIASTQEEFYNLLKDSGV